MTHFLKRLFRSSDKTEPMPSPPVKGVHTYERFQTLGYTEILSVVAGLSGDQPLSLYIDISRRCYEIALLDEEVSDQDRASAWELGEAANATLKKSLSHDPKSLADLEDAKQGLIEQARKFGPGSLVQKLKREPENTDPFSYAMMPSNRSLVGVYLEAVFAGGLIDDMRLPFIRELIRQSNYGGSNAVLILHGLAAKRDPALLGLFSADEFNALLQAPENYQSARSVLVGLGLLPSVSGARPFKELPNIAGIVASILKEKFEEADTALVKGSLSEIERELSSLAARFLFIDLASSQLTQIFESSNAYESFKDAVDNPETSKIQAIFTDTRRRIYRGESDNISLDMGVVLAAMTVSNLFPESEEEFENQKKFWLAAENWLNSLRVPFLEYFRFVLRAMADPMNDSQSPEDKQLLGILATYYRENGARSAIAERAMNFEDWIGYSEESS